MGHAYYLKETLARQLIKSTGITLLTEKETAAALEKWQVLNQPGSLVLLEEIRDAVDNNKVVFTKVEQQLPNICVYKYVSTNKKIR